MRHLTSLYDLQPDEISEIIDLAIDLKSRIQSGQREPLLQNHVLAQVFEKPSLRTRNSFEAAMVQLGGAGIFMSTAEAGFQGRESLPDIARVLSSYSDIITLRTFSQDLIEDFSQFARCPVINALSDDRHPCQALTDLMTIQETFGSTEGKRLVYAGDGNNVAKSLAIVSAQTGMSFVVSAPEGFELPDDFLVDLRKRFPSAEVEQIRDPQQAVADADAVYTDVWASMGQESEKDSRRALFADWQVNESLMASAPQGCRFMHDLPARRGEEVTDGVIDSDASIVFQQAENRMHLARSLMLWLIRAARTAD